MYMYMFKYMFMYMYMYVYVYTHVYECPHGSRRTRRGRPGRGPNNNNNNDDNTNNSTTTTTNNNNYYYDKGSGAESADPVSIRHRAPGPGAAPVTHV